MKIIRKFTAPESLFVLLAVVFGLMFIILTPPLQAPDERNHFVRAYAISECGILCNKYPSGNVGSDIPKNLIYTDLCILFKTPFYQLNPAMFDLLLLKSILMGVEQDPFESGKKHDWKNVTLSLFSMPLIASDRGLFRYPNTALYSPLAYAPQSASIALGRLVGLPPIAFLYIARTIGLFLYIVAVRWAIKSMPAMKWGAFVVALTPTALFQASSISIDIMTNATAFVLFAMVTREALKPDYEPMDNKTAWSISVCAALVAHLKFYLFIPFLPLILPHRRGRTKAFAMALLLSFVLVGTWSYLVRDLYVPLTSRISPTHQLAYISDNPIAILDSFFHTVTERTGLLIMQFVGRFSHYHLYLPQWLSYLHIAVLIGLTRLEGVSTSRYQKAILGAVFFLSMGLLYFLNYLTGTPVGSQINIGVQGRYIYPVLLPALMMIAPLRSPKLMERIGGQKLGFIIGTYSAALLIVSVSTVYTGYYG